MKRPTIAILFGFAATALLFPSLLNAEKPDVRGSLLTPTSLVAGSKSSLIVEMTLGTGWHVNSHIPSEKYLIPTVVTLAASAGELSPIQYPKDIEKRFSFADKPLRVYEGTVRFETSFQVPASASGEISITGNLSYQACNDQQCFAPSKIPLAAKLTLSAGNGVH
jgi:hypothetical protein